MSLPLWNASSASVKGSLPVFSCVSRAFHLFVPPLDFGFWIFVHILACETCGIMRSKGCTLRPLDQAHRATYAVFTRDTITWGNCHFTIENVTQYNRDVNLPQVNVSRVNTALVDHDSHIYASLSKASLNLNTWTQSYKHIPYYPWFGILIFRKAQISARNFQHGDPWVIQVWYASCSHFIGYSSQWTE